MSYAAPVLMFLYTYPQEVYETQSLYLKYARTLA